MNVFKSAYQMAQLVEHAIKEPNATSFIVVSRRSGQAAVDRLGRLAQKVMEMYGIAGDGVRRTEIPGRIEFEFTHSDCRSRQRIVIKQVAEPNQIRGYAPSRIFIDTAVDWPVRMEALREASLSPDPQNAIDYIISP